MASSENINNETFIYENMNCTYPKKRLGGIIFVMVAMLIVAVLFVMKQEYGYAGGIVAFMIYVPYITFAQKKSEYRFEFAPGRGLRDMKVYYRGNEIRIDHRLDRNGRFMWENTRKEINNIGYADGSRMSVYFTRYRVFNFVNAFLEQNGLKADISY